MLPDFLCNSGGVTVWYFEQVQNGRNSYWPIDEVHRRLDAKMTAAYESVHEVTKSQHVHSRLAAHLVSVKRVKEAFAALGCVR